MYGRACLVLICLCGIAACSAGQPALDAVSYVPAELPGAAQVQTELPQPNELSSRTAMIAGNLPADCDNVLVHHPSAAPLKDRVSLHSTTSQTSWAAWGWYGLSASVFPERIAVSMLSEEEPYYVMLADFAMQRWRSYGPCKGGDLQLDPGEFCDQVLGRDGTFYVVILAADGSRPSVSGVQLLTSNVLEQPARIGWTTASYGSLSGSIQVDWEAVGNAGEWTLLRSRVDDPADLVQIPVNCCSHLDSTVQPGVAYHYRVQAANLQGIAPPGPRALGMAGPVTGLSLSGILEYDESHPAAGVELQLGNGSLISSTNADGHFRFDGLSAGLWTLWRVDSQPRSKLGQYQINDIECDTGNIALSTAGTVPLDWYWIYPPQNLTVGNTTPDSITLRWDPAQYATVYEVYRGRFGDPYWAELQDVTELTSIALLEQGSGIYYYWIRSREEREGFSRVSAVGRPVGHSFSDKGLLPDTIYAIPDRTEVQAGEIVTYTVLVHQTASPLNFINSVRVTFEDGNIYVPGSFNPGSVGGSANKADGIWSLVDPKDGFLQIDAKLLSQGLADHGRVTLDFNVTPLKGRQISNATGALFNFQLIANTDINLSFQTANGLLRTYYSDGTQQHEHTWKYDDNMGQPVVRVLP
jgi:hypothetical protein